MIRRSIFFHRRIYSPFNWFRKIHNDSPLQVNELVKTFGFYYYYLELIKKAEVSFPFFLLRLLILSISLWHGVFHCCWFSLFFLLLWHRTLCFPLEFSLTSAFYIRKIRRILFFDLDSILECFLISYL